MKTAKRIILLIVLAFVLYIAVCSVISYKKTYRSFSDFLDDPFRIDRYSDYGGFVTMSSEFITDDGQYTVETEDDITVLKLYNKESRTPDELLRYVTDTKKRKNKFYVKAGEGYAVINTDNKTCKIHILVDERDFIKLYGYDENKNVIYKSRFSENPLVTYCVYDDIGNESKLIFYTMK